LWIAALVIMGCMAVSCGEDDGVMDRPDYTMVRYQITLGTGWLQLYDVTIDYLTADGQAKSLTLKGENWDFEDKVDGRYTKFLYRVTAKAKRTTFDLNDPEQAALLEKDKDLTYAYEYYYYEKETSAHTFKKKDQGKMVRATDVAEYVAANPEIILLEHSVQLQ